MADVTGKRLELLRQLLPRLDRVVTFYNPKNPVAISALTAARAAAHALAVEVVAEEVATPNEIRERLLKLRDVKADAFFFVNDSMVQSQDKLIIDEATRLGMASMAYELQLVSSGALAGYGLNYSEFGLLAAKYVGAILQGANASDLPVEATAPQFAINLRTAKALNLTIPPTLLARADEVIE
jgi:putative ABC transport system substrate-binding protein